MTTNQTNLADALNRAHKALLDDLRKLEMTTDTVAGAGLSELRTRLAATQRHLTEHFRFEEQNGYMDVVRKREPRLDHVIQQLADEHRALAHTLDTIVREVQTRQQVDDTFRKQIQDWITHVRRHEECENDLVQDAFNQETAAED